MRSYTMVRVCVVRLAGIGASEWGVCSYTIVRVCVCALRNWQASVLLSKVFVGKSVESLLIDEAARKQKAERAKGKFNPRL